MEHICGYNGNMTRFCHINLIGIDKKRIMGHFAGVNENMIFVAFIELCSKTKVQNYEKIFYVFGYRNHGACFRFL